MQGSVRDNLDPMGRHSDRELITVLKSTRLWDILCGVSLSQSKGAAQAQPAACAAGLVQSATVQSAPALHIAPHSAALALRSFCTCAGMVNGATRLHHPFINLLHNGQSTP